MPDWTQELKDEVIEKYKAENPTPENTVEIVKAIADEMGNDFTVNGVRTILHKADVYVKKTPATGSKTNGESKRVNKADAINNLSSLIESNGLEADGDILGKLTGKAAIYFKEIIEKIAKVE
jgi:hypothetical protein